MGVHLPILLLCMLKFSTKKCLNVFTFINNAIITIFLHIFCMIINSQRKFSDVHLWNEVTEISEAPDIYYHCFPKWLYQIVPSIWLYQNVLLLLLCFAFDFKKILLLLGILCSKSNWHQLSAYYVPGSILSISCSSPFIRTTTWRYIWLSPFSDEKTEA